MIMSRVDKTRHFKNNYSLFTFRSRGSFQWLHHWNVKLLRVCGFSREAVPNLCIPACLGRKVWETVAMIIDLHLYIELTMPKGNLVKSTSKSIICNIHNYFDWQSKKQNPSHQSYVRKLLKPLASQSTLSTVSYWRKASWMEVLLHHQ